MNYNLYIAENDCLNLNEMPSEFTVVFRRKSGSLELKASHVALSFRGIAKSRQETFLADLERLCQKYQGRNDRSQVTHS